jgi:hypothetical protein
VRALVLATAIGWVALGQERFEITASAWRIEPTGTIQSGIVPVDLRSDLALGERFGFAGRLIVFPSARHGIVIEGTRMTLEGDNDLARTIVYAGRTYNIRERIRSAAELTTVYGGYQYSVISGARGRLALGAGAVYVAASGSILGLSTGVQADRQHQIGLPLASVEARLFVMPGSNVLEIAGDLKGMAFGGYGRYFQGGIHGGVNFGRVGVRIGYRIIDADLHEDAAGSGVGVAPRLAGPVFSVIFRY